MEPWVDEVRGYSLRLAFFHLSRNVIDHSFIVAKAVFCPCVVYANNAARLEHLDRHDAPHPSPGTIDFAQCCVHACATLFCFSCCLSGCLRGQVRERYEIHGSGMGDCAESFVLYPCALHQETREIELEESVLRGQGVDSKDFYIHEQMSRGCDLCGSTYNLIGEGRGCSCFNCCFP
jgi:Cys-rich protein (TIGR01571 family)